MMEKIKNYKWLIMVLFAIGALLVLNPPQGQTAVKFTIDNLKSVFMVLPPIFILIGLMDVWMPKDQGFWAPLLPYLLVRWGRALYMLRSLWLHSLLKRGLV